MESGAALGRGARPRGRSHRLRTVMLAALALVVVIVGLFIALRVGTALRSSRTHPSSVMASTPRHDGLDGQATWAAGARPAPAIATLQDQTGHRFSLASLHGHTVALVFFDSHCHQECPLEGRALAQAERVLPAAQRPVLVAVSINPLDTPSSARHAIRSWGLAGVAPWHWLMGRHARLAPVWRAYRIYVGPAVNGDIAHTEAVYLIDRSGYERSAYLYPFVPRFVSHDLRRLASS